jgi:glycosyltransferase involved in cell wall biosynthesis
VTGLAGRLRELADVLGVDSGVPSSRIVPAIAAAAGAPSHAVSYLVLAAIHAEIPRPPAIKPFTRRWRLDGLEPLIRERMAIARLRPVQLPIRIVHGPTLVDVTDTLASSFTTGIQRVARETVARWGSAGHDIVLVRWDSRGRRLLTVDAESRRGLVGDAPVDPASRRPSIAIPYRTAFVLPEISVRQERTTRLRTIGRYAAGRTVAIGFDCIPITSAETTGDGMPGAFSKYLSALARFDVIAPISESSATEFRGWRRMLAGTGISGPAVETLELPFTTSGESDRDRAAALRHELGLGDDPIVLSVGSHEPRKNHLSLLHAAERVWRSGERFTLVMVGGNSWDTGRFDWMVDSLRRRGRPIITLSRVSDDTIWDLYDMARFSVFCSLNEGFGLPVVESLSHGTPVITSDFGSMRALGVGHGGLAVPPLDIDALTAAIGRLLRDDDLHAELVAQTALTPATSWESYADDLWKLAMQSSE